MDTKFGALQNGAAQEYGRAEARRDVSLSGAALSAAIRFLSLEMAEFFAARQPVGRGVCRSSWRQFLPNRTDHGITERAHEPTRHQSTGVGESRELEQWKILKQA